MAIKKKIQPKYRLPLLNWTPIKPQAVKGTVFADLDDEKLYRVSKLGEAYQRNSVFKYLAYVIESMEQLTVYLKLFPVS